MAPTNTKTVHQTSLLHIESNLDPLGMLPPTHDQRSQQKNGKNTLQPVLINKAKFLKATHCTEIRKIEIPRSMVRGGGLELVKPAREPASRHPKPCASLKKPHESYTFAHPCGSRRKKNDRGQTSAFFHSETSRFKPVILAHRLQTSPGSPTIELPSAFAESGAYPPDRVLPGSPRQCSLPLACRYPPEGHQIGTRKRHAPGNTILSQPYHRRVSTDRLNREGSQLAASAGKTLPYS